MRLPLPSLEAMGVCGAHSTWRTLFRTYQHKAHSSWGLLIRNLGWSTAAEGTVKPAYERWANNGGCLTVEWFQRHVLDIHPSVSYKLIVLLVSKTGR